MSRKHENTPSIKPIVLDGYTLDLQAILSRDYDDISVACVVLPQYAEWVNEQLHTMHESRAATDNELRIAKAEAYFKFRARGLDHYGVSKVTEAAIEHAIELDSRVQELGSKMATLDGWCRRLARISETLIRQMDLIRSSEATRRKIFDQASD